MGRGDEGGGVCESNQKVKQIALSRHQDHKGRGSELSRDCWKSPGLETAVSSGRVRRPFFSVGTATLDLDHRPLPSSPPQLPIVLAHAQFSRRHIFSSAPGRGITVECEALSVIFTHLR